MSWAVVARGPIATLNPTAKLLAAFAIALPLIFSVDLVSPAVALVLVLPVMLLAGLTWRQFWWRTAIVWIGATLGSITVALYGVTSGEIYFEWLLIRISDGSLHLAGATFLRVLALALPGVVLFSTVDPTDLADGLAQRLKLPARFVLGALGALRLFGVLVADWRELEVARRARGVADDGRIRRALGMAFALLVLSLRRGGTLATAMESRGFGSDGARTWARPSPWGAREWLLIGYMAVTAAISVAVAMITGVWNFIF